MPFGFKPSAQILWLEYQKTMQNPLALIHPETYPSGRINNGKAALVRTDSGKWVEKLYRQKKFLTEYENLPQALPDAYFSINSFSYRRRMENLVNLNCFHVDLDPYDLFKTPDFVQSEIEKLYHTIFPPPSLIYNSGRGLWLLWLLEPMPRQALEYWARCQSYLIEKLGHLGADKKACDATRVMRLPNTLNSKCNKLTYFTVLDPNPVRAEIFRPYLPQISQTRIQLPKKQKSGNTHPKLFSPYSLNWAIIDDLEKLAEMRGRSLMGHRELYLFIWRNCLAQLNYEPELSAQILRDKAMIHLGTEPLSNKEWTRSTMSPYRVGFENGYGNDVMGYKLSHHWIINALNITPTEQGELKTLISTEEKYRRYNDKRRPQRSKQSRAEYLQQKDSAYQLIRELRDAHPNATAQQIADLAKVSRRTVFNALKS